MKDKVILGLGLGHDASATVIRNGEIVSHILRERHSGYRHHFGLDYKTIELALKEGGCSINEIDYCAITAAQMLPAVVNNKTLFSFRELELKIDPLKKIYPTFSSKKIVNKPHVACGAIYAAEWDLKSNEFIRERINEEQILSSSKAQDFFKMCKQVGKLPEFMHEDWELIFYVSPIYGPKSWKTHLQLKDLPSALKSSIKERALESTLYHCIEVFIKGHRIPGFFIFHHLAHAASSYYSSSFEKALIFTHDGGIDIESGFLFVGEQNSIFPVGPHYLECGHFYEYVAYRCGFDILGGAGKLMGLSSYGKGELDNILPIGTAYDWLEWEKNYLGITKSTDIYASMLEAMLSNAHKKGIDCSLFGHKEAILSPVSKEIAYATQKHIEDTIITTIQISKEALNDLGFDSHNLCLSGGVALNCPTNSKLWNKGLFQQLHIEPHCDDGGLSIGAAQFVFFDILGYSRQKRERPISSQYAMLGASYGEEEVEKSIQKYRDYIIYEREPLWYKKAANDLSENRVIGVYQKKSETGPRALGHRSILAHPGFKENWERVNNIKGREQWRPFAPVIMQEELFQWFELGPLISPFMLFTYKVKDKKIELIPAVTHVDQTSRVQTVNQNDGEIYDLIKCFKKITNLPVIMNTSFNGPGQPIIEFPESAIEFLLNSQLSVLYLHDYRIERRHKL